MVGRKRTTRNANNAPKKRKKATPKSPAKKVEKKVDKKPEKKPKKETEKKVEKKPRKKIEKKTEKKSEEKTVKKVKKSSLEEGSKKAETKEVKPRARKKRLIVSESPIEPMGEPDGLTESAALRHESYDAFVEMEQEEAERASGERSSRNPLFLPEHRLEARVHESAHTTAHSPIHGAAFMGQYEDQREGEERKPLEDALEYREQTNGSHTPQQVRELEEESLERSIISVTTNEIQGKRVRVVVRDMEIDDLAAVFHLGEELFTSENYPMLYRTWDEYEVTGLFHADSDYCLVAEGPNEQLLGFVMGTTIDKGTAWTYGYVTWLGVAPGWQRAGVGQQLMDAIEDRMLEEEDVRMFIVDTSAHNVRGIRFFQRQGFEQMQKHVYLWKTLKGDAKARVRSVRKRRRARRLDQTREEKKKG
ncbi:GNAT family N-acetyltransferase [Myxococcota bacterium]|nr:GNAT family N-acetyltransferase [Myxococcota bacterium]